MPFQESSLVQVRERFCKRVGDGESVTSACREEGISRQTGYRVLAQYLRDGREGLLPHSRRPHFSPNKISEELEDAVVRSRLEHPTWGARKLSAYLLGEGVECPKSTIGRVLKRNGLIKQEEAVKHRAWKRFESGEPNQMWQMDFTDFRPEGGKAPSHVLVILDDASRYAIRLGAYSNEQRETVKEALKEAFQTYGLPNVILTDNGAPWGSCGNGEGYTKLSVWLIRLNIRPVHSRAYHPQTIGKVERFNRTLKSEVDWESFEGLAEFQVGLDAYLDLYNSKRPHASLGERVPASLYRPSPRPYPEKLEAIENDSAYLVRKVGSKGEIYLKNRVYRVGQAFTGLPVGLQRTDDDKYNVYFMRERIAMISLSPDNQNV